jgi:hypothetical protein
VGENWAPPQYRLESPFYNLLFEFNSQTPKRCHMDL